MKTILLTNTGNRNIKVNWKIIDKKYLEQKKTSFYEETKFLYENIKDVEKDIEINIIDKILEKYEDISEIYMFATNQTKPFHSDTYYEAKIIEYKLKDKYKIHVIEKNDDPRVREEAFKFFENFFDKHKELSSHKLIISWSWWIPAMKEALNFYSVINFINSTIIDVDENTDAIILSKVGNEYLKNIDKKTFREMIEKYDYSWAYTFLKNSKINNIEVEKYSFYLSMRYNFDFNRANTTLQDLKSKKIVTIPEFKGKSTCIDEVIKEKYILLKELIQNIEITYKKWEYTMMVWKIFSLYENMIKYFFEEAKRCSIDDCDKLKKEKLLDKKNKYADISLLKEVVEKEEKYEELFKWKNNFFTDLENLKKARNDSISAHWLKWVKKEDVEKFNEILSKAKDYFWIKINIYDELNIELLDKLK